VGPIRIGDDTDTLPIFWSTTSTKALPFFPLLAKVGIELGEFETLTKPGINHPGKNPLVELVTNQIMLQQKHHRVEHTSNSCDNAGDDDEEFYKQLGEASLSVQVGLKEKGLLTKRDIWDCVPKVLHHKNPS
jgi:hypothetical protein